jgi:hypothetical protein
MLQSCFLTASTAEAIVAQLSSSKVDNSSSTVTYNSNSATAGLPATANAQPAAAAACAAPAAPAITATDVNPLIFEHSSYNSNPTSVLWQQFFAFCKTRAVTVESKAGLQQLLKQPISQKVDAALTWRNSHYYSDWMYELTMRHNANMQSRGKLVAATATPVAAAAAAVPAVLAVAAPPATAAEAVSQSTQRSAPAAGAAVTTQPQHDASTTAAASSQPAVKRKRGSELSSDMSAAAEHKGQPEKARNIRGLTRLHTVMGVQQHSNRAATEAAMTRAAAATTASVAAAADDDGDSGDSGSDESD